MIYTIILVVLLILFLFRLFSGSVLKEDKSQILIFFVYLIYALITINHKFMEGSIYSHDAFNLISYFLLTTTYILIGEYLCCIYPNMHYRYLSLILYGCVVSTMVNQYILCIISNVRHIYYIGLIYLSILYICFSLFFWIKDFRKLSFDTRLLMLSTNIMILSFSVLEIFNLMHIPYVAICSLGLIQYIISAEFVSIKRIKQRLYDMESIQIKAHTIKKPENKNKANDSLEINIMPGTVQKVFDIMVSDNQATAKDIANKLNIKINTSKSYISQIYARLQVHSRTEFNELIERNTK